MKKLINCYQDIISPENIWQAWLSYRKGKRNRQAVSGFEVCLENNLLSLRNDLISGNYQHGGYRCFLVHDPKRRTISAPSVRDHLVHQAVYNILYEFYDQVFCFASFSCRKNKGLYLALNFVQKYLRQFRNRECWVLHGDIKKCFDSINHRILKKIISERICCDKTLHLLWDIIDSYEVKLAGDKETHGIPLGNLTSQLFINIYLDVLDRYVKEELKIKKYVRYADDFYIFCEIKDDCLVISEKIRNFLINNLCLEFPLDHQEISNSRLGTPGLGYVFFPGYLKISSKTYKRMMIKLKDRLENYNREKVSLKFLNSSWQSFKGVLDYGNNYHCKKNMLCKLAIYLDKNNFTGERTKYLNKKVHPCQPSGLKISSSLSTIQQMKLEF